MDTFLHTPLEITPRPIEALAQYARNAKTHGDEQVAKLVASLREFGWTFPILTDEAGEIIAGHGRVLAARRVLENAWTIPGWPDTETVPVLVKPGLTESQKRAYRILDNRVAEDAGWDADLLALDLSDLVDEGFDLDLTGLGEDEIGELLKDDAPGDDSAPVIEAQEPSEEVKALLDRAWVLVVRDWCEHIRRAGRRSRRSSRSSSCSGAS